MVDRCTGYDDLCAPRADALDLAPFLERLPADQASIVCISARETVSRGRRFRVPIKWLAAAAKAAAVPEVAIAVFTRDARINARSSRYFARNESAQLFHLPLARWIVVQKFIRKPHRSKGQADGFANVPPAETP